MDLQELRGYQLDNQIYWARGRLVIIWLSKIDRESQQWRQIQLTLVGAKLNEANVVIDQGFPPLISCEISEKSTVDGNRKQFTIHLDGGEISFQCEDIAYTEYSRRIRISSENYQGGVVNDN